ncbi:MAG: hypothetical protein VXZ39_03265 [Planctomycetota bacterium]|nr:hypothetical protein [Planctomycetota bacterium]
MRQQACGRHLLRRLESLFAVFFDAHVEAAADAEEEAVEVCRRRHLFLDLDERASGSIDPDHPAVELEGDFI